MQRKTNDRRLEARARQSFSRQAVLRRPLSSCAGTASLAEYFRVSISIEPHQHRLADDECRGPEVTGWAEHELEELVVIGPLGAVVDHLLALGADDAFGRGGEFQCILASELARGTDLLCDRMGDLRKKLLRFGAGRSPFAVVVPIYFLHRDPRV